MKSAVVEVLVGGFHSPNKGVLVWNAQIVGHLGLLCNLMLKHSSLVLLYPQVGYYPSKKSWELPIHPT